MTRVHLAQLLRDLASGKGKDICTAVEEEKVFLAICGGYQMMGRTVSDPDNTEGGGSLRGIGDTLVPFIITAVGICIARVVWIYTVVPLHNDISTVAVAYPITWGLTSLAYMIYFRYVKKYKIGKMEQAA